MTCHLPSRVTYRMINFSFKKIWVDEKKIKPSSGMQAQA
jgi:hypothetical protein